MFFTIYLASVSTALWVSSAEHSSGDLISIVRVALRLFDDGHVDSAENAGHLHIPRVLARKRGVDRSPSRNFAYRSRIWEKVQSRKANRADVVSELPRFIQFLKIV